MTPRKITLLLSFIQTSDPANYQHAVVSKRIDIFILFAQFIHGYVCLYLNGHNPLLLLLQTSLIFEF